MNRIMYKRLKNMYFVYIFFLLIFSLSFALMPFGIGSDGQIKKIIYLIGAMFWIGLIGIIISSIQVSKLGKIISERLEDNENDKKRVGIISFFQTKPAKIADLILIISLVLLIVFCVFTNYTILKFLLISIVVFSFGMHCVLNGINYSYIANRKKRGREQVL